ncbi:hypothetical protein BUALT_Bualt18G0033800 [Buddleja alternifolia]|uniref:Uncharacterized protein n=1 Tax=Buddleja alternifolia TaxID=168488 RepID=A0AAV6W7V9_9LAMI|nr:hypothetical protein BUALT_Bualt18G0033800 [Buddleja alternifolia]
MQEGALQLLRARLKIGGCFCCCHQSPHPTWLEAAISASTKLLLSSPEKLDLLLTILKNNGFSDAHIAKMVTKIPGILKADPEKTILPKLQFFPLIGVPPPVLAKVVSTSRNILKYSLQNSIIPAYNILKILLKTDERVVHFIKRAAADFHFIYGVLKFTRSNVALLRKYGVRELDISFLITNHPKTLIITSDRLVKLVDRVIELGVDSKKIIFVQAMQVLLSMSKSTWEHKKQVYQRCGWSESDIIVAFSVHPMCMSLSEKKITATMEFLVNEMSFEPSVIARCAQVICYNLERRIKPRCRVAKVLLLKVLLKKSYILNTFLWISDKVFLDRYVSKYQKNIPLLDVYLGNSDGRVNNPSYLGLANRMIRDEVVLQIQSLIKSFFFFFFFAMDSDLTWVSACGNCRASKIAAGRDGILLIVTIERIRCVITKSYRGCDTDWLAMHQLPADEFGENGVVITGLAGFMMVGLGGDSAGLESVGFNIGFVIVGVLEEGLAAVGTVVKGVVMSICLVEIENLSSNIFSPLCSAFTLEPEMKWKIERRKGLLDEKGSVIQSSKE